MPRCPGRSSACRRCCRGVPSGGGHPGLTGLFFKQFAVTIAVATALSAVNSLSLTPALCPILLGGDHGHQKLQPAPAARRRPARRGPGRGLPRLAAQRRAARLADGCLGAAAAIAGYFLAVPLNWLRPGPSGLRPGGSIGSPRVRVGRRQADADRARRPRRLRRCRPGYGFGMVPGGFIPQQDQGYAVVNVQLPDGASLERTRKRPTGRVVDPVLPDGTRDRTQGVDGIAHMNAIAGYSIFAQANISNAAGIDIAFDPFAERVKKKALPRRHPGRLQPQAWRQIEEGRVTAFGPRRFWGWAVPAGSSSRCRTAANLGLGHPGGADLEPGEHLDPGAGDRRDVQHVHVRGPAIAGRDRRRPVLQDGRAGAGGEGHPPGLPGVAVRQRRDPVQPELAGERPGRRASIGPGSRTSRCSRSAPRPGRWCRWLASSPSSRPTGRRR